MSDRTGMFLVLAVFAAIEMAAVAVGARSLRHLNPQVPAALRLALFRLWPPPSTLSDAGWKLRRRALVLQGLALLWLMAGVIWLARGGV